MAAAVADLYNGLDLHQSTFDCLRNNQWPSCVRTSTFSLSYNQRIPFTRILLAKLIASLKYNAPHFHDLFRDPTERAPGLLQEAYEAYIQRYEEHAQRTVNRSRILWYRIAWEIHHLARRFKRDQFHPVAFERAVALIGDLSAQLRRG